MWGSSRRGKHTSKGKFRPWRLMRRVPSLLRMLSQQRKKGNRQGGKQTPEQFFAQIDNWVNYFMQRDLRSLDDRALWAEGIPAWRERGAYVMSKNIAISAPSAVMFGLLERLVGKAQGDNARSGNGYLGRIQRGSRADALAHGAGVARCRTRGRGA